MTKKYIHKVTKEVAVPCPDGRYILNSSLLYIPESILTSGNDWEAIEKYNRHPGRYWYPENDYTEHYYINTLGGVDSCDKYAVNSANYWNAFETKQEAEKELEKRKAIVTIKRYISENFGVFEPDWGNVIQYKISPMYDISSDCFDFAKTAKYKHYSPIGFFSCVDHVQEIIEKFDAELRIIFDIK